MFGFSDNIPSLKIPKSLYFKEITLWLPNHPGVP
jgi:hypothetical protein